MSNNIKFIDYVLMVLLIAISALPITSEINEQMLIFLLFLSFYVFKKRDLRIDMQFLLFVIIFITITFIQVVTYKIFPIVTVIGMFVKLLTAYFVVKSLRTNYFIVFTNIMVVFTLLSFLFWVPAAISHQFAMLLDNFAPFHPLGYVNGNYIIYHTNMELESAIIARNCGPFWEPGVFGGFLIITFIFNFIKYPSYSNKINRIILLGILTTFSTTAYIVLFTFLVFYYFLNNERLNSLIMVLILLPTGFFAFNALPFLGDKFIIEQNKIFSDKAYSTHRTRITSAIVDFKDFQKNPFTGRGKFEETRFVDVLAATNRNNGTTDFLVIFGLVGFVVYFYFYYKSFYNYISYNNISSKYAKLFVIILMILGFSENYFLLPFFWGLCFLRFNYSKSL